MDSNVEGPWDDVVLEEGEVRRIINAFLTNPERQNGGASEEEITQVLLWAREIKLKAAININILRLIYLEEMVLNLNEAGEVTMQTLHKDKPTFAPDTDQIESWLDM
jgi:hypothetical protein